MKEIVTKCLFIYLKLFSPIVACDVAYKQIKLFVIRKLSVKQLGPKRRGKTFEFLKIHGQVLRKRKYQTFEAKEHFFVYFVVGT